MFRTAGLIDANLAAADGARELALLAALEEFAVEASIAKIAGSETLDFVLDENVQIHGGNGYVRDYPAERHYRDARVNRIFEGTNEINRLLVPGMLIKRAMKGDLALIPAAKRLLDEVLSLLCCRWMTTASAARLRDAGRRSVQEGDDPHDGRGTAAIRPGVDQASRKSCCGWPIWPSIRTPPKARCFVPRPLPARATARCTLRRSSLRLRCGASGRGDGASRARGLSEGDTLRGNLAALGDCFGWRQRVRSPRGGGCRTPSSRAARISSEPRRSGILVAVTRQRLAPAVLSLLVVCAGLLADTGRGRRHITRVR